MHLIVPYVYVVSLTQFKGSDVMQFVDKKKTVWCVGDPDREIMRVFNERRMRWVKFADKALLYAYVGMVAFIIVLNVIGNRDGEFTVPLSLASFSFALLTITCFGWATLGTTSARLELQRKQMIKRREELFTKDSPLYRLIFIDKVVSKIDKRRYASKRVDQCFMAVNRGDWYSNTDWFLVNLNDASYRADLVNALQKLGEYLECTDELQDNFHRLTRDATERLTGVIEGEIEEDQSELNYASNEKHSRQW